MRDDAVQNGVVAPRVEGPDMVVVQRLAVYGPDRRHGGRELLLVLREGLELVHRDRLEVERAGQGVELLPRPDHQRGVFVVGQRGVFRVRIGVPDPGDRERIGGEERAVDVVVAEADLVELLLRRADAVLQDPVLDHRLAVLAQDAVHLGRVEEVREDDIGDRDEDEAQDDLADQPVCLQLEGHRHDVVRQCLSLVRELFGACPNCVGSESVRFFPHRGKISFVKMQI